MVKYCLLHSIHDGKYSVQIATTNVVVGEVQMFRTPAGIVLGEVLALGDKKDMALLLTVKNNCDVQSNTVSTQCDMITTNTVSTLTEAFLPDCASVLNDKIDSHSHKSSGEVILCGVRNITVPTSAELFLFDDHTSMPIENKDSHSDTQSQKFYEMSLDNICRTDISESSFCDNTVISFPADRAHTPAIDIQDTFDPKQHLEDNASSPNISENDIASKVSVNGDLNQEPKNIVEVLPVIFTSTSDTISLPLNFLSSHAVEVSRPLQRNAVDMSQSEVNATISSVYTIQQSDGIRIPTIREKKRFWCHYCQKTIAKFSRHLEDVHRETLEVKEFTDLPKRDPKRMKLIAKLRAVAEQSYNTTVGFKNKNIMVRRRPSEQRDYNDFLPCSSCKCYFIKGTLALHFNRCNEDNGANPSQHPFMKKVLATLYDDHISYTAKNDELIMFYANFLCSAYVQSANCVSIVRAKIRLLGRILVEIKEMNPLIKSLEDCFNAENFDFILRVAKTLGKFDNSTGKFVSPSVPNDIGITLRNCARVCENWGLINKKEFFQQKVGDFLKLMNTTYAKLISKQALICQKEAKFNRPVCIPSASDVALLMKYLHQEANSAYEQLTLDFHRNAFDTLNETVMLLLLVFNRRRTGETEKLCLKHYLNKQKVETISDLFHALSEDERHLSTTFWHVEIMGKRDNGVPVLFTDEIVSWTDKIVELRSVVGIKAENQFLFANDTLSGRYSACTSLVKHASLCGAKDPSKLRGTLLRKQFATIIQMLDLAESDMRGISAFMGHAMDIHLSYYRKPSAAFQSGYISKTLLAAITENPENYKGQTISTMAIPESILNTANQETQSECCSAFEQDIQSDLQVNEVSVHNAKDVLSLIESDKENMDPNYELPIEDDITSTDSANYLAKAKKHRGALMRNRWSLEEKSAMLTAFGKHIDKRAYPSFQELIIAKTQFVTLKRRTTAQMKAWIQAEIKKQYVSSSS